MMDWAEDIISRLASFTSVQQLAQQAEAGWRAWFVNEGGTIDGWGAEELNSHFRSHTLCFESGLLLYPYITTTMDLFAPNGEQIGRYRLITRLNGETDDDYLEIDGIRNEYQERQGR